MDIVDFSRELLDQLLIVRSRSLRQKRQSPLYCFFIHPKILRTSTHGHIGGEVLKKDRVYSPFFLSVKVRKSGTRETGPAGLAAKPLDPFRIIFSFELSISDDIFWGSTGEV